MDKPTGFIYESSDYSRFKMLDGNRFVDHSDKIIESIKLNGQLMAPIIVNENMEIIDGQNRFEAYKKLGLPVQYIVSKGYGIAECIAMNSVSKNWTTNDYIKSYSDLGNKNFQFLQEELSKYHGKLPTSVIIAIVGGNIDFYNKNDIRKGTFTIGAKGAEAYDKTLEYLTRFNLRGIRGYSDRLYKVLAYCYIEKEIDSEKLVSFFEKYSYQIDSIVDTKQAAEAVEKVYNFKCNKSNYVFIAAMYSKYAFKLNALNLSKGRGRAREQRD